MPDDGSADVGCAGDGLVDDDSDVLKVTSIVSASEPAVSKLSSDKSPACSSNAWTASAMVDRVAGHAIVDNNDVAMTNMTSMHCARSYVVVKSSA